MLKAFTCSVLLLKREPQWQILRTSVHCWRMLTLQTISAPSPQLMECLNRKEKTPTFFPDPFKRLDTLEGVYGMVCVIITNSLPMKIPSPLSLVLGKFVVFRRNTKSYFLCNLTQNTFARTLSQLSNAPDLKKTGALESTTHRFYLSFQVHFWMRNETRVSGESETHSILGYSTLFWKRKLGIEVNV